MPSKEPHYPRSHYDASQPLPAGQRSKRALKARYDTKHCWTINDILHAGLDYGLLQNLDGGNTTRSALRMAASTPGAATDSASPRCRNPDTATRAR